MWIYGDKKANRYNGVVILGEQINPYDVQERNGIHFTSFNRTITDALANESILDMQGITEALSRYYYSNNESFDGLFIPPEYQERFKSLALDAIDYYSD